MEAFFRSIFEPIGHFVREALGLAPNGKEFATGLALVAIALVIIGMLIRGR